MGSIAAPVQNASLRDLYVFILGTCKGDNDLCDGMWSVLMGDTQAADAACAAGVDESTMSRRISRLKSNPTFQRMTLEANGKATDGASQV